jgi:hypothetical protein
MLSVELHKLVTGEKVNVGPCDSFRLSRNVLQTGDEMVAVYSAGLWRTSKNCFLVLSIGPNVQVTYSSETAESEAHGPFEKLFVVDGAVHAGEREGSILARFEEPTGHWLCLLDRRQWRDLHFSI